MEHKNRRSYLKGKLEEHSLPNDPFILLENWLSEVRENGIIDYNAMTLSTIDAELNPDARIVLLREIKGHDLIFFTSYTSPKALQIDHNDMVVCSFYWSDMERAVRIKGQAEKLSVLESEAYYKDRPSGSQLAAWVAKQSEPLQDRADLEERFEAVKQQFGEKEINKPLDWGGYRVKATSIEFFQGREHRLNDRISYQWNELNEWVRTRLAP